MRIAIQSCILLATLLIVGGIAASGIVGVMHQPRLAELHGPAIVDQQMALARDSGSYESPYLDTDYYGSYDEGYVEIRDK
ncbi:hypothetical protein A2765_05105 [Candidatus Kaiserbacteria bacterium RIFCSPHIGHO2_01_FULL_56_24]|uniref:Uncharacterized protein n=1 Tax=Candidatus Kaiserbacteria bacterium RIFCSPHIGHO2_01_FULL_56_24 TaxID=1798487 RepID=A0A1F6D9V4_9BACT|nr:MAG: hypothetical protein A2765_05105 [Candidatus Kaiserbacteria bacterium RIFCSPHIGHO2_01_FULL_56_24]